MPTATLREGPIQPFEERPGPWSDQPPAGPPVREPMFRAPWPPLLLSVGLVLLFAAQSRLPNQTAAIADLGFVPLALSTGRWTGLVTSLFVHGGWAHVLLNALALLAFGTPVARLFGPTAAGVLGFFAFYFACGLLSNLGYAGLHPASDNVLIGASGAVSGLMGAASRLIERRPGLAPFSSPPVIGMAVAWIIVNLLVAVFGFGLGAGSGPIAWEAHLVGYAAGLLLVWPAAKALGRL